MWEKKGQEKSNLAKSTLKPKEKCVYKWRDCYEFFYNSFQIRKNILRTFFNQLLSAVLPEL